MLKLGKGSSLNLTKSQAGLTKVNFALGWGGPADLDALAVCFRGKSLIDDDDVLYYNSNKYEDPKRPGRMLWVDDNFRQPYILKKALIHSGDELQGGNDGDDEVITVDLAALPDGVDRIAFCVNIHEGKQRRQTFALVSDAFIRLDNASNNDIIGQYDLSRNAGTSFTIVMGTLVKEYGEWTWTSVGEPVQGDDLNDVIANLPKVLNIKR